MNRKQRRADAAQLRAAKAAIAKHEFPPGYVELVERIDKLIGEWLRAQPTTPYLAFHDRGTTLYAGSLGNPAAVKFLANSADAYRLCAWLDEQTGGKATVFQVDCVLRQRGVFDKRETKHTSKALEMLTTFAKSTGTDSPVPPTPCGWCGMVLEMASGEQGQVPVERSFSLCVKCGGVNQFGAGLVLERFPDERFDELPEAFAEQLRESRDLIRSARMLGTANTFKKETVQA
jgi:hypothetical protein